MSILKVAHLGHPVLRQVAEPVAKANLLSATTQQFIDDLIETVHEYDGVGLAAPQVHVSQRIFVVEILPDNPRYTERNDEGPLRLVMINPSLKFPGAEKASGWEGCLSLPNIRGLVPRYTQVQVTAWDRQGNSQSWSLQGFAAIVVQHENDHLDGILYPDRMSDLRSLTFDAEYDRFWKTYQAEK